MSGSKNAYVAVFLCFLFGPFALGYVNKKAGIFLSLVMTATIFIGFYAVISWGSAHPLNFEDLNHLQTGNFSASMAGLQSIFYILCGAIIVEWIISMVWAFILAKANQKSAGQS